MEYEKVQDLKPSLFKRSYGVLPDTFKTMLKELKRYEAQSSKGKRKNPRKAPDVKLDAKSSLQIAQYNSVLMAPFLVISNGMLHFFFRLNDERKAYEPVEALPVFF